MLRRDCYTGSEGEQKRRKKDLMLRGIWVRCVLALMTVLLATPLTIVLLLVPRWSNLLVATGKLWSRTLLAATGARVTFHGIENAYRDRPCIFISNHQSFVDIWVMFSFVPPETRFVAKQELFRVPFLGWALSASGCIPINRGNRAEAIRSLRLAAERIRAGRSVILFPEGSRSEDGRLAAFKKGGFHLALQAGVSVVPVAITGSFDVMPKNTLKVTPGPVEVFIEPPIDVTRFQPEDHRGLLAEVHEIIERRFDGCRQEQDTGAVPLETS